MLINPKQTFLFKNIQNKKFFIFAYYVGSLPLKDFISYRGLFSSFSLSFFRFKESSFYVNKQVVAPLLQGSFAFFFPTNISLITPKDLVTFLHKLSTDNYNYFLPACIGTSRFCLSFQHYMEFHILSSRIVRLSGSAAFLLIRFYFSSIKSLIALNSMFIPFTHGYYKSIN